MEPLIHLVQQIEKSPKISEVNPTHATDDVKKFGMPPLDEVFPSKENATDNKQQRSGSVSVGRKIDGQTGIKGGHKSVKMVSKQATCKLNKYKLNKQD